MKIDARFPKPAIIIGGCGRSGTSLLLSVLSAHPSVFAIPNETSAFCPTAYTDRLDLDAPFALDRIRDILRTSEIKKGATRWCEKTPKNVLFFGRLLKTFGPDVRLLNIVRDGRDVITSRHPSEPKSSWVGLERWVQDVGAGAPFDTHPQVLVVKYEHLVAAFSDTMKRICGFLEEEATPEILDWHRHTTLRTHGAWDGSVKAIHGQSVGKWRRPENLESVSQMTADSDAFRLLKRYGYVPADARPTGAWAPGAMARRFNRRLPAGVKRLVPEKLKDAARRSLRKGNHEGETAGQDPAKPPGSPSKQK
ncbi:MAG: sulfotransferase [Verrucomicrobia bacterium]|nr:sulfotransferase [Verrucomicrobiota bacterium]MDE3098023.1 sulfotransferase [Verrucomicrobiota bacterium]